MTKLKSGIKIVLTVVMMSSMSGQQLVAPRQYFIISMATTVITLICGIPSKWLKRKLLTAVTARNVWV